MEDYAQRYECGRSVRTSSNQLELMSWLFDDWAPMDRPFPQYHNEVLTNIHSDMILGVLSDGSNADCVLSDGHVATVCKDFFEQFARRLRVISIQDGIFVVEGE